MSRSYLNLLAMYAPNRSSSIIPVRLAVVTTLLASMLLFAGCGGNEKETAEPARPVRTAEVVTTGADQTRAFAGRTQAPVASTLSFKVEGTVAQRPVRVGERLEAGALVAALDPTDYQIQVQEAEAALLEARSRAQNAEAEYARIRGLYAEDLVARSRFDQAQTQRVTSQAALEAAEQRLALARQRLSYTRLHAPERVAVADVRVETGENVQPGQPVARLTTGGALEVEISVPEGLIARIHEGDMVRVSLAAYPDTVFQAAVTEVGVAPRTSATAYPVVVQLADAPERLRPGMAARVAFAFHEAAPAQPPAEGQSIAYVTVPPEAVGRDAKGRTFAYVVEPLPDSATARTDDQSAAARAKQPDGVARRRAVEIGTLTPQGLNVRGLKPGEHIITAGVGRLTDGQLVRFTGTSAEVSPDASLEASSEQMPARAMARR